MKKKNDVLVYQNMRVARLEKVNKSSVMPTMGK